MVKIKDFTLASKNLEGRAHAPVPYSTPAHARGEPRFRATFKATLALNVIGYKVKSIAYKMDCANLCNVSHIFL